VKSLPAIAFALALSVTEARAANAAEQPSAPAPPPAAKLKPAPPAQPAPAPPPDIAPPATPPPADSGGGQAPVGAPPVAPTIPTPAPAPPPAAPAAPPAVDQLSTPGDTPPPPPPPVPPPSAMQPNGAGGPPPPLEPTDDLPNPGYVPGYRAYQGSSLSPYSPRVGSLAGGVTPGYGAPMPPAQWTFRYSGFMTVSLQGSLNQRRASLNDQRALVFHTPPQTLDEYASFVGTTTMPGNWVAMNFAYGTPVVTANVSINTWSPSAPSTYYQIGSQYFINNAFLRFDPPRMGGWKLGAQVGYFYNFYGNLGQYTPGMYTNSIIGSPRGVGETVTAEYRIDPKLSLLIEHGIMGNRNGKVPTGLIPNGGNGTMNPIFGAAYMHHVHVGFRRTGEPTIRAGLHWLTNFTADDTAQQATDNPVTRGVDETHIRDGRIDVFGADTVVTDPTWGYFGAAASYTKGRDAYGVKGLTTFGGEGSQLTERYFGNASAGTGKLFAAGVNWGASLGRILSSPNPFSSDRPDVVLNAGFVIAYSLNDASRVAGATDPGALPDYANTYDHRLRYKFGADLLYTFWSWLGAGVRADRVAPNSKDSGETFYVLAPRVVFKRSWNSRENITLLYAKWFNGPHSHPESSSLASPDRVDDQLIAVNVNMYW
jgi:hypothetical protein